MIKQNEFDKVQHLLPESVKQLVKLIGVESTFLLIKSFGGTTFPVSQNKFKWGVVRYEMLAEVIGVNAADILTNHYGGSELYIPRCLEGMTEVRDRAIRTEYDRITLVDKFSGNHAAMTLALKFKLSDRQVWNILKQADKSENPEQNALF